MTEYRRAHVPGATWSFTVNLAERSGNRLLVDKIHWNPVKHGWVTRVADWPHSSFHDYAARGIDPTNWGCAGNIDVFAGE